MSASDDPCEFEVLIPRKTLMKDLRRFYSILMAAGEVAGDLGSDEMMQLVIKRQVLRLLKRADDYGLRYHHTDTYVFGGGDCYLTFRFDNRTDAAAFRIMLL